MHSANRLYPGRYEIECGLAALEVPFQKISTCVRMKMAVCSRYWSQLDPNITLNLCIASSLPGRYDEALCQLV